MVDEKQSKSVDFPQGGETTSLVGGPDEVGPEHNGEVHRCHFVNFLVIRHLCTHSVVWCGVVWCTCSVVWCVV